MKIGKGTDECHFMGSERRALLTGRKEMENRRGGGHFTVFLNNEETKGMFGSYGGTDTV